VAVQGGRANAFSALVMVVLVGLQLWAIVEHRDDWPFASNSMFSFARRPNEAVYDLDVRLEVEGRWRALDPVGDLGFPNAEGFPRVFFSKWYGSTDPTFPQRTFSTDDRAHFVQRMTEFCRDVVRVAARQAVKVDAVSVDVIRLTRTLYGPWKETDAGHVGSCDADASTFA